MRVNEYDILMKRAYGFYKTGLYQLDHGLFDLAAFSFEQYLQLFLKAILLKNGIDFPRIHGVRALLRLFIDLRKNETTRLESLMDKYELELSLLEDAYITSRYIPKEFSESEVRKLLKAVEEIVDEIKRIDP